MASKGKSNKSVQNATKSCFPLSEEVVKKAVAQAVEIYNRSLDEDTDSEMYARPGLKWLSLPVGTYPPPKRSRCFYIVPRDSVAPAPTPRRFMYSLDFADDSDDNDEEDDLCINLPVPAKTKKTDAQKDNNGGNNSTSASINKGGQAKKLVAGKSAPEATASTKKSAAKRKNDTEAGLGEVESQKSVPAGQSKEKPPAKRKSTASAAAGSSKH